MDANMKEELKECNVDVDVVLERFMGNEALVKKFMIKFLDDPNFKGIGECITSGDVEEGFKCAHTLKGVCANLGLTGILEDLSPIVELLRSGRMEGVKERYESMERNYEKLGKVIRKMI